jgi:hypothetical protein
MLAILFWLTQAYVILADVGYPVLTKIVLTQVYVILADVGYPVLALWCSCFQRL